VFIESQNKKSKKKKTQCITEPSIAPTVVTPTPVTPLALASTECQYGAIFGPAGSGKTHLVREVLQINPNWGLLTATTGVAASILGPTVPTMHSALGISDTESTVRSFERGTLVHNAREIARNYDRLVIDEMSMLNSKMFDVVFEACKQANLGIVIVGDFLQLAPVPETDKETGKQSTVYPVFDAKCWNNFAKNTITLQTQFRHTNAEFLKALNLLRAGKGYEAIEVLKSAGVKFVPKGTQFDGNQTTIVATHNKRSTINDNQYAKLNGQEYVFTKSGWGYYHSHAEWSDQSKFPDSVTLKVGTRVMILRNLYSDDEHKLLQTNGDMGVVIGIEHDAVYIKRDDGTVVQVNMMEVDNGKKHVEIVGGMRRVIVDREATCGIRYMPLTPAWALTVHKSQGLTIAHPTRVEMEQFFSNAGSVYVACSRVKNPEDLTIVHGDNQLTFNGEIVTPSRDEYEPALSLYCKTNPKCTKWL
jgi:ATP-dependent DNA helicase PIF1